MFALPHYSLPEGNPSIGMILPKENLSQVAQALNQTLSEMGKLPFYEPLLVFQEIREITRRIQEVKESVTKKIERKLISQIDENPNLLHSKEFFERMKVCIGISPDEEKLAKEALDEFANSKWGASMGEKTQRFLINEIFYIVLKLKQEGHL